MARTGKTAYISVGRDEKDEKELPTATVESVAFSNGYGSFDNNSELWTRGEVQPPAFRDKKFAIAFVVHLFLVVLIAAVFVIDYLTNEYYDTNEYYYTDQVIGILGIAVGLLFLSTIISITSLHIMEKHADKIIKASLFFSIGLFALFGLMNLIMAAANSDKNSHDQITKTFIGSFFMIILAAISGDNPNDQDTNTFIGIFFMILAVIMACGVKFFLRFIPFASSTLSIGSQACKANLGVFGFAMIVPFLKLFMFILQAVAMIAALNFVTGVLADDYYRYNAGAFFGATILVPLFLLSMLWTSEVIKNISTVTVSGTIGTWWFAPLEANRCCSKAVMDSFKRSVSYSFGSICKGSLLTATIRFIKFITSTLRRMQRDRRCIIPSCVITCILGCMLRILEFMLREAEYFNKWAFVYVGLYGYDYTTAGKNVLNLFKSRGWSSIISQNLITRCLGMVAFAIGLSLGLITLMLGFFFGFVDEFSTIVNVAFVTVIFSTAGSMNLLSVVGTATDTAIVCFAEGSAEFDTNHPELSAKMHETYSQAFPDIAFRTEILIDDKVSFSKQQLSLADTFSSPHLQPLPEASHLSLFQTSKQ